MSDNQAIITCPIFGAKTKVESCVTLRNRVYTGKHIEVRKGCQACMASGKCPIARDYAHFIRDRLNTGVFYQSEEPKEIKLRAEILEEIRPVIVQETHIQRFAVPVAEQQLIATANDRIDAALGSAPRKKAEPLVNRTKREVTATRTSLPIKPKAKPEPINEAAATGDMSAAINAHAA